MMQSTTNVSMYEQEHMDTDLEVVARLLEVMPPRLRFEEAEALHPFLEEIGEGHTSKEKIEQIFAQICNQPSVS